MTATALAPDTDRLPRPLVAAGLAGTTLVAVGGLGAGALPGPAPGSWLGIGVLAGSLVVRVLCVAVVAVGVALLLWAWWGARRAVESLEIARVGRLAALWSLPLLVAPPMFSRDVYAYGAQGVVVARGFDPYRLGPIEGGGAFSAHVDVVWRGTPSPYGPAYLGPASEAVRLSGSSVEPTVLLLRLLAVLGLVVAGVALVRLARAHGVPPQRALWLTVLNPLTLLHGVAGAHNDVLMIGLMLAGLAVATGARGRPWPLVAAGALVALGALVKVPAAAAVPALVLAVPGVRARVRTGALVGAGAGAVLLGVPLLTGLGYGWLFTVNASRHVLSLFSPVTGIGTVLGGTLRVIGVVDSTGAVRTPVLVAGAVLAVLAGGAALLLTPRLGALRAVGISLLALVVLSPTVLPWYALWAVMPLAAGAGRRLAAGLAGGCLALSLLTLPDGHSVVRPPLYGLPVLLALGAAAVALRRESRPADLAANLPA